jgi:hypothetical protein
MLGCVFSKVATTCLSRLSSSGPDDQPASETVVVFGAFVRACALVATTTAPTTTSARSAAIPLRIP